MTGSGKVEEGKIKKKRRVIGPRAVVSGVGVGVGLGVN